MCYFPQRQTSHFHVCGQLSMETDKAINLNFLKYNLNSPPLRALIIQLMFVLMCCIIFARSRFEGGI